MLTVLQYKVLAQPIVILKMQIKIYAQRILYKNMCIKDIFWDLINVVIILRIRNGLAKFYIFVSLDVLHFKFNTHNCYRLHLTMWSI